MEMNDSEGWSSIFSSLNQKAIISGDYFTMTNPYKLQAALEKRSINGIVIKPTQAGTITESLAIAEMAKTAGLKIIVSARTSETNDSFLADFDVKFGGTVRGERVAKYNRLMEIEKMFPSV
jgi:enolase